LLCPYEYRSTPISAKKMSSNTKSLIISHGIVFLVGFAAGKLINQDELDKFRALNDSASARYMRKAQNVMFGMVLMGSVIVLLRASKK
jgi:hypothetical protein